LRETRRILFAAYYFPPDVAVGGLRVSKFVRYMPEFGLEPYVITVKDQYRERIDNKRLVDIENIRIIKTRELPTVRKVMLGLRSLLHCFRKTKKSDINNNSNIVADQSEHEKGKETLMQKLKRYFVSLVVLLPDDKKNWSHYAAFKAILMIRKYKIDIIVTSSPPNSVHFIGLLAKLATNVKWIADFRDPWYEMIFERSPSERSKVADWMEGLMERSVIRYADKIITTTNLLKESMIERYRWLPEDKFIHISNSIDTDKFQLSEDVQKYAPMTITYAGTFYFDRTPEPLFKAVSVLVREKKICESNIRIKLLGNCQYINNVPTRDVVARYGLESIVEVLEPVPYLEAINVMKKSHLLLVLAPIHHRMSLPAKLFDYLGSGSKILALAEKGGSTSDLLEETKSGNSFSHFDIDGLREYIYDLMKDESYKNLKNNVETFRLYDAKYLTRRLVEQAIRQS
jgi:glycosyltransferase involved in cell wall biosynthesis